MTSFSLARLLLIPASGSRNESIYLKEICGLYRVALLSLLVSLAVGCLRVPPGPVAAPPPPRFDELGCPIPNELVGQNQFDLEISSVNVGKVALGKIQIKDHPELINLMSKGSKNIQVQEYYLCRRRKEAQNAGEPITREEEDYYRRNYQFMQSEPPPTADQFLEWQQRNPPPQRVGRLIVSTDVLVFDRRDKEEKGFTIWNEGSKDMTWWTKGNLEDNFYLDPQSAPRPLSANGGRENVRVLLRDPSMKPTEELYIDVIGADDGQARVKVRFREEGAGLQPGIAGIFQLDTKSEYQVKSGSMTPVETISEFRVLTRTLPRYEVGTTGTVNAIPKQSPDRLHGTASYFHQNSALNARNFFAFERPKSVVHKFGVNGGGAIPANRSFIYAAYEANRNTGSLPFQVSVPTQTGLEVARSILASKLLKENSVSKRLLEFYPLPNRPGEFNNLSLNSPKSLKDDFLSARLDHAIGEEGKHKLALSYRFSNAVENRASGGSRFREFLTVSDSRSHVVSFSLGSQIGESKFNEFRFGYQRNKFQASAADSAFVPGSIGLDTGVSDRRLFGLPSISITGLEPLGAESALPYERTDRRWEWGDNFVYNRGSFSLKLGSALVHDVFSSVLNYTARGRLSFDGSVLGNPLADFLGGFLSGNSSILRGNAAREVTQNSIDSFVDVDVGISKAWQLQAALNYHFAGVIKEKENRMSNFLPELGGLVLVGSPELSRLYNNDSNNFAPRVGLTWSPYSNGKLIFRLETSVYYQSSNPRVFSPQGPLRNSGSPGFLANPIGSDPVFVFRPGVPILLLPGEPVFGSEALQSPVDIGAVDANSRSPWTHRVNAGFDFNPQPSLAFNIAYTGSFGRNLWRWLDMNQPTPGDRATQDRRRPFFGQFPQFRVINLLIGNARSHYHALSVSSSRRLAKVANIGNLQFHANWTLSKSIDDEIFPQDSRDLRAERARSDADQRHRFTMSLSHEFPPLYTAKQHPKGRMLERLGDGWSVFAIWVLGSGLPTTPFLSFDNSGAAAFVDRPDVIADPTLTRPTAERFLNKDAFQIPPPGFLGNAGRNILNGPGLNNLDFALTKKTLLAEGKFLYLTWDIFNLFNRTNFSRPDSILDSPTFGTLTSTAGENRTMQVSLKISF